MEYYYGLIPGTNDHSYNQNYYNRSIRKEGVMGLKNINASSCFMNASIQCLVHLKEFNTSIISKKKPKEGSLVYEIKDFIKEMSLNNEKKSYSPKKIREAIGKIDEKYLKDRQRDANEFISNCIMAIHDETKKETTTKITDENLPEDLDSEEKIAYAKIYNKFYSKNDSFIIDYFYGDFIDEVFCEKGHRINVKFQPYNMIELPVIEKIHSDSVGKKYIKLEEVLEEFITPKKSSQKKNCPKCEKEVEFTRRRKIYSTPKYLILYLNNNFDGHYNNIELKPSKEIYMSKYMYKVRESEKFTLVGAIEYIGTGNIGHYIAECYNYLDYKWYCFNDELVKKIDINYIDSPIILFYEKLN